MKLYRIRRKADDKFFVNWKAVWNPKWAGVAYYSDSGVFFKRIDTVTKHLKMMCCDWEFRPCKDRLYMRELIMGKFHRSRLKNYEIVISDVSINGEEVIQAKDLMREVK